MYVKLFASLYQGTLRGKAHEILVFTNMLAHCDREGYVDKHFKAIAEEVGLTLEQVQAAIAILEAPDDESRSPEEEGRRIVKVNDSRAWGWKVVNYGKYRDIRNDADRREQNRLAQERWRTKHKPLVSNRKQRVITNKQSKPIGEGDAEGQGKGEGTGTCAASGTDTPIYSDSFETFWKAFPRRRRKKKPDAWKAWQTHCARVPLAKILAAVETQANHDPDWLKDGGEFIPMPSSWIRARGWEDDVAVESATPILGPELDFRAKVAERAANPRIEDEE